MLTGNVLSLAVVLAVLASGGMAASEVGHSSQAALPSQPASNVVKNDVPTSSSEKKAERLFAPLFMGCEDEWKIQFGGEVRARAERRDNFDMNRRTGDKDNLGFLRTRLNLDAEYRSEFRTFLEVWDLREIDEAVHMRQEDHFDVHQFFLEWKEPSRALWRIRVGRQELGLGRDGRLAHASSWGNIIRSFDGARLTLKEGDSEIDAFVLQPLSHDTRRGSDIVSDRARRVNRQWFYGLYGTFKQFDPHTLESYFLGLSDLHDNRTFPSAATSESGRAGTSDRYSVGSALYGPLWKEDGCGTLAYGLEAAFQFGHRSNDEIRAHMLHGDLNYTWDAPWKPKIQFDANLASGDRRDQDGSSNTFNPLFGSNHTPFGIMDFTRLSNLRELAVTGSVQPKEKIKLQLEFHSFWLDSKKDSWFSGVGGGNVRDKTGRSGRHIGNEIDFIATYKLSKWTSLEAGLGHFFSGNFAENNGRRDGANFGYLQTSFTF